MKLRLPLIICLIIFSYLPSNLYALNLKQIKHIYIFGDSLSDAGYMDNSPAHFLPKGKSPTYTSLHGHVWGYYLAKMLNVPFSANNLNPPRDNRWVSGTLKGNDYAAGGARAPDNVRGYHFKNDYNPPSLQWQVKQFLKQHHNKAPQHAIYFIWIGANDVLLPALQKHALQTLSSIKNSVNTTAKEVTQLKKAGAKHIILINVPPIGDAPLMNDSFLSRVIGNWLTDYYNRKLIAALKTANLQIPIFNANQLFNRVYKQVRNTGSFSYQRIQITNVTDSGCLPHHYMAHKNNIAINCIAPANIDMKHYMFADLVHPSDAGHYLLAHYLYKFIKQLPN